MATRDRDSWRCGVLQTDQRGIHGALPKARRRARRLPPSCASPHASGALPKAGAPPPAILRIASRIRGTAKGRGAASRHLAHRLTH